MQIFSFQSTENQAYLYAPLEISQLCDPLPPRSLAAGWRPPIFELVRNDDFRSNLPKTDCPHLCVGTAVLSARAVDRLHSILTPCGEILPIQVRNDTEQFFLFNVTKIINAVDMERSEFMVLPSGAIGYCKHLVFNTDKLKNAVFFKTTEPSSIYDLFASEAAVKIVNEAGLTGFDFIHVWTSQQ